MSVDKFALAYNADWSAMTGTFVKGTDSGEQSSSGVTSAVTVIRDMGSAMTVVRIVAAIGTDNQGAGSWSASNDGSTWTSLRAIAAPAVSADTVSHFTEDSRTVGGTSGTAYRYWRVTYQDTANGDGHSAAYVQDFALEITASKVWDFSAGDGGLLPYDTDTQTAVTDPSVSVWAYGAGAWQCRNRTGYTMTATLAAEVMIQPPRFAGWTFDNWRVAVSVGGTQVAYHKAGSAYGGDGGDATDAWLSVSVPVTSQTRIPGIDVRIDYGGTVLVRQITWTLTYTPTDGSGALLVDTHTYDFTSGDNGFTGYATPSLYTSSYDGSAWRMSGHSSSSYYNYYGTLGMGHAAVPYYAPTMKNTYLQGPDDFTVAAMGIGATDRIGEARCLVGRSWLWGGSPGAYGYGLSIGYRNDWLVVEGGVWSAGVFGLDTETMAGSSGSGTHTEVPYSWVIPRGTLASGIDVNWKSHLLLFPLHATATDAGVAGVHWVADVTRIELQIDYDPGGAMVMPPSAGKGVCLVRDYTKLRYVFLAAAADLGAGMPAGSLVVREDSSADAARQYLPVDSASGCSWPSFFMDGAYMVGAYLRGTAPYLAIGAHGRNWQLTTIPGTYTALAFAPHAGRYVALGYHDAQWYCRVGRMAADGTVTWSSEVSLALADSPEAAGWLRPREDGVLEFAYLNGSGSPEIVCGYGIALDGTGSWT